MVDKPGGHKQHVDHVPLVGGIAIFLSVFLAWLLLPLLGMGSMNAIFVAAGGLLFAVGLVDDRVQLSVKFRFVAQIAAALLLVYSSAVLKDFGYILSDEILVLGMLSIPITIFATLGVINAMNMLDGVDGLAGAVSLASLSLILVVAYASAHHVQIVLTLCMMGALCGFLVFNLRWNGKITAKVYMGDAGSTLLGFLFAFLLISLSQGEQRAIPPVAVLWLFAVPLMDTVGVMIRRIWHKQSPFSADRGHLHHLLIDAGFRVPHVICFMAFLQLALGAAGLVAVYQGISELVSFTAFITLFLIYTYLISRPWRFVPKMRSIHRKTDLAVRGAQHIYIRDICGDVSVAGIKMQLGEALRHHEFKIFEKIDGDGKKYTFGVIDVKETYNLGWILSKMKKYCTSVAEQESVGNKEKVIRQYITRDPMNDRRCANHHNNHIGGRRQLDRRSNTERLIYCTKKGKIEGRETVARIEPGFNL